MIYYLYHIPGKKIGVTRDLEERVTNQQGYEPHEYEVLYESEDIDWISELEINQSSTVRSPVRIESSGCSRWVFFILLGHFRGFSF